MIADQTVYVDLESHSLCSESERVSVFINKETADALTTVTNNNIYSPRQFIELTKIGKSGIWDGQVWQVINVGTKTISLLGESSKIIQLNANEFKKLIDKQDFKAIDNPWDLTSDISSYLKDASVDDLEEASRRYSIISPYLQGEKADFSEISERTFYRSDFSRDVENVILAFRQTLLLSSLIIISL